MIIIKGDITMELKTISVYTFCGTNNGVLSQYFISKGVAKDKEKEVKDAYVYLCSYTPFEFSELREASLYYTDKDIDEEGKYKLNFAFEDKTTGFLYSDTAVKELPNYPNVSLKNVAVDVTEYRELPEEFFVDLKWTENGGLITSIVTHPNETGRKVSGKKFFVDLSCVADMFEGTARVRIKKEKDNVGFLVGSMLLDEPSSLDEVLDYICNSDIFKAADNFTVFNIKGKKYYAVAGKQLYNIYTESRLPVYLFMQVDGKTEAMRFCLSSERVLRYNIGETSTTVAEAVWSNSFDDSFPIYVLDELFPDEGYVLTQDFYLHKMCKSEVPRIVGNKYFDVADQLEDMLNLGLFNVYGFYDSSRLRKFDNLYYQVSLTCLHKFACFSEKEIRYVAEYVRNENIKFTKALASLIAKRK